MTTINYPRYSRDLQATLTLSDGRVVTGNTASLSTEGASLIVDQRLLKDDHGILALQLKSDPETVCFKLRADISYCSQQSELSGFAIGLRFTDPPEHYLSLIEHLDSIE